MTYRLSRPVAHIFVSIDIEDRAGQCEYTFIPGSKEHVSILKVQISLEEVGRISPKWREVVWLPHRDAYHQPTIL